MGGCRNGHFWGAPIFGQDPGKYSIFPQKDAKSGRPKNSRSYHHPSHPPVDALLNLPRGTCLFHEYTRVPPTRCTSHFPKDPFSSLQFELSCLEKAESTRNREVWVDILSAKRSTEVPQRLSSRGNSTMLMKTYMKVCLVVVHMFCFHMFYVLCVCVLSTHV